MTRIIPLAPDGFMRPSVESDHAVTRMLVDERQRKATAAQFVSSQPSQLPSLRLDHTHVKREADQQCGQNPPERLSCRSHDLFLGSGGRERQPPSRPFRSNSLLTSATVPSNPARFSVPQWRQGQTFSVRKMEFASSLLLRPQWGQTWTTDTGSGVAGFVWLQRWSLIVPHIGARTAPIQGMAL
jgi:hypothetical protein